MNHSNPTILVIIGTYLPGTRTGGPIRATSNMVQWLGDDFCFRILTSDREEGTIQPYPNIQTGTWNKVNKAQVRYLNAQEQRLWNLRQILYNVPYDILYLDSVFAPLTIKTLLLRRLRQIPLKPLIIPPRGHLHPGALHLKSSKKRLFLWVAQHTGLYADVIWHASTSHERADIIREFGNSTAAKIEVISEFPAPLPHISPDYRPLKEVGKAQIVFLSRISPKKNLLFTLSLLNSIRGQVQFDIYGPIEDTTYWAECRTLIAKLPPNISINYKGTVPFDLVTSVLSRYHLFVLPTLGENFGHVILEAFCAGSPVLISDQTPWTDLVIHGAGWALPLAEPGKFRERLQYLVDMDASTFNEMVHQAQKCGNSYTASPLVTEMREFISHVVT